MPIRDFRGFAKDFGPRTAQLLVSAGVGLGQPAARPTGLPIDLIWGIVMLVFGLAMLLLVRRSHAPAPPGESGAGEPRRP